MTVRGSRLDPVSNRTAAFVAKLAKTLGFYLERQQQYAADRNHDPSPTSEAAATANDPLRRTPSEVATLLQLVASDHLRTVGAVLNARVIPSWGLHSLLRVVVEASARTWWMLEPGLDVDAKASRGLLARLEMLRERDKLEGGSGNAAQRIQELLQEIEQAGFVVELKRDGSPRRINGTGYADTTGVLRQMLPDHGPGTGLAFGEFLYRLLSGATHGAEWMATLNAEPVADLDQKDLTLARTAADPHQVGWLLTAGIQSHATAFDAHCRLNGWTAFIDQPFYRRSVLAELGEAVRALGDAQSETPDRR